VRAGRESDEDPLFLPDELLAASKGIVLLPERVGLEPRTIGLVSREIRDGVDAIAVVAEPCGIAWPQRRAYSSKASTL